MINYVNNAYDKVLKPCDAQQFMTLTQSGQTEKLILAHRAGDPKAKSKLPAITYMGVLDEDKYREYLKTPSNNSQARLLGEAKASVVATDALASAMGRTQSPQKLGSRRAEFMRPTGLLMLDFDHVGASPGDGVLRSAQDDRAAVIDSPVKLWEYIGEKLASHPSLGGDGGGRLALAHVTPSGDGLRLVVKREKGKTIEQAQYDFCQAMEFDKVGVKADAACKDISRLSFVPMHKEVLYFNPDLLFGELPEASDYPDGSLWGGEPLRDGVILSEAKDLAESPAKVRANERNVTCYNFSASAAELNGNTKSQREILRVAQNDTKGAEQTKEHCPSETGGRAEWSVNGTERRGYDSNATFPTDYNGIPYTDIVTRLEEQLGGRPEHGARNSFIFTMACNLRYVCNDDPAWIASILPTYGEEPMKHRMTIQSAVNRPMSRTMPETMARALRIAKMGADSGNSEFGIQNSELGAGAPPELPHRLPPLIALLVSRTPEKMRPAVAMAVFPPLAAHLCGTEFVYVDNRSYEATFMTLLMAELSSGKSAVNQPIEYIIADMRARDEVARTREREWREACSATPDSKEKPKRPEGLGIQVLTPDMTNAAFVQRLADAKGRFLYTVMDEVELLDGLKTNGRAGSVSQILRLAFDCGVYGQERVGGSSVNEQVKVRWNWNASTTIQRGRNYFRNSLTDGTLSRLSLATIVRDELDWGRKIPKYGTYGQAFADALRPYIDSLNMCRGVIHSPEALLWAEAMIDEQVSFAESCDDRAYAQLSFRAVLMGFLRGMVLYVMNGMRWTAEISDFAAWTVRYDMWCKMHFFGDLLHQGLEAEVAAVRCNHTRSLLDLLPETFTRQMAQEMRMAQGRNPNPSDMLRQWLHRGFIARGENEMYYKLSK